MGKTRENFIKNLRRRRKAMRLTQAQLAEKVDKAVRTYQAYEDGSVSPPPETMDKIAEVFGCDPFDLYADPKRPQSADPSTAPLLDAADILSRLASLSPLHRQVVLALIYKNPDLIQNDSNGASDAVQALLKGS